MFSAEELWCMSPEQLCEASRRCVREYEEAMFRWLAAKRDYPYDDAPEPETLVAIWLLHRERIVREFNRSKFESA